MVVISDKARVVVEIINGLVESCRIEKDIPTSCAVDCSRDALRPSLEC